MQQKTVYSVDDLVANASFKKWILLKDEQEAIFWHQWLSENPDKLEWVEAASTLVLLLNRQTHLLEESGVQAAAAAIQSQLDLEDATSPLPRMHRRWVWTAAAVLLLLVTSGVLFFLRFSSQSIDEALLAEANDLIYENKSDTTLPVSLPDGSKVLLEKGASLHYAGGDSLKKRTAFLVGNAFFDIAHNPSQPFVVYTHSIVTRVLGTSFWVKAMPDDKMASVIVRTGKVSVYKKEDFIRQGNQSGTLEGVVLTPNQQVSYDIAHDRVSKALVAAPIAAAAASDSTLNFEATPAVAVFHQLEDIYGIPIVIDERTLSSCSVTVVLGNEKFYEKIAILCKIINAGYEVIDGSIVITSKGCK